MSDRDIIKMRRYAGEDLDDRPHIVVLGSCKVGNFVVTTPTLNGLKSRFPKAVVGFIGSDVTADFEQSHPSIDWRLSWDDVGPNAFMSLSEGLASAVQAHGPVALAINLDGFNPVTQVLISYLNPDYVAGGALTQNRRRCLPWGDLPSQAFLADPDWDSPAFLERYSPVFRTQYIAELFAHLAGVAEHCDPASIALPAVAPSFVVPDVLIHCTTARAAKVWSFQSWRVVVDFLVDSNYSVGLVGAPQRQQQQAYNSGDGEDWLLQVTKLQDLRGRTSLIELAGACQQARAVVSVDAGPLHIAAAMGVPTLAVVGNDGDGHGASPIRLWMPRAANAQRTVAEHTCLSCVEARFSNDSCLEERHHCMLSVAPEQVISWLQSALV